MQLFFSFRDAASGTKTLIKMWSKTKEPEVTISIVEEPATTGQPVNAGPSNGSEPDHQASDTDEVEVFDVDQEPEVEDEETERVEEESVEEESEQEESEREDEEREQEEEQVELFSDRSDRPRVVMSSRKKTRGKTFHYKHFSVLDSPSLSMFLRFLKQLDGGEKSERESMQCAVDLSKYLYFGSKSSAVDWECLINAVTMRRYLDQLVEDGIGYAGQLTKLQRIEQGIQFLLVETELTENQRNKLMLMQTRIKKWQKVKRKKQEGHRMHREQELAENPAEMTGYEALFQDSSVEAIESIVSDATEEGSYLTNSQINIVASWLFAAMMYGNSQRPGAILGMTTEMYEKRKKVIKEGVTYTIIKV